MKTLISVPAFLILLILISAAQAGCIRLWGGASYVQEKPGEKVQKTYILDTYEFTNPNPQKGSIE